MQTGKYHDQTVLLEEYHPADILGVGVTAREKHSAPRPQVE